MRPMTLEQNPAKASPGPDPGLKTLAIRICSDRLIWRESLFGKVIPPRREASKSKNSVFVPENFVDYIA